MVHVDDDQIRDRLVEFEQIIFRMPVELLRVRCTTFIDPYDNAFNQIVPVKLFFAVQQGLVKGKREFRMPGLLSSLRIGDFFFMNRLPRCCQSLEEQEGRVHP